MSHLYRQIRSGTPDEDPLKLKNLILGKPSSSWSTSNLRGNPVQPTINASDKKGDQSNSSFVTTPLRGEVQKTPIFDHPLTDKDSNSFTSVPLTDKVKERANTYPAIDKAIPHLRQDNPAPTQTDHAESRHDPIKAYLDKFLSLSEIKKVSTPELMWISQFIEGESREQQLYLLRELEKMEGSLPSI